MHHNNYVTLCASDNKSFYRLSHLLSLAIMVFLCGFSYGLLSKAQKDKIISEGKKSCVKYITHVNGGQEGC